MQSNEREIRQQLLKQDEHFARLASEHTQYESMLQDFASRPHLTDDEQVEEHRIKKMKLAVKDQMEEIVHRHLQAV